MSVLRRIRRLRPPAYRDDPAGYWDRRHGHHQQSLDGVGCIGLGESGNRADYDVKRKHVAAALDTLGHGPGTRALDAGCGIGEFTPLLLERGFAVTAADFSAEAITIARERLGVDVEYVVSDLASIGAQGSFGVVMCIDVLFHIVDDDIWEASVAALAAATEDGGALVIQDSFDRSGSGSDHVRWRSLDAYRSALDDLELITHDAYGLPAEGRQKDLLTFRKR